MGGDAVGAGDSWRGGRSGTHWKDRGKGEGRGRGRQEKRQGHQLSGPLWGTEQESLRGKWEEGRRGRSSRGAVGVCKPLEVKVNPSWEGWALMEKDSVVCIKDLPLMLPALELSLLKVRLGAWRLSRNLHIPRMC